MPIPEPQVNVAVRSRRKRIFMDMGELSTRLAGIALPVVKKALETELLDVGADAWKTEGEQALRALLRDEGLLSQGPQAARLLGSLKDELKNPSPPDEEEIQLHAQEVGKVMASAWVQFIALALRTNDELVLGESLLPSREKVAVELWDALRNSLNSLAVGGDEAPTIMQAFAAHVVARSGGVTLPMGIVLDPTDKPSCYVVRRH